MALPYSFGSATSPNKLFMTQLQANFDALSGGQLAFPATQNASSDVNTLDDYEEGTFTPTLTFATAGDLAVTYTQRAGNYTKIGRDVRYHFVVQTSAFTHTTASGACTITGFPFTIIGASYTASTFFQGITKAGYTQVNGLCTVNTTTLTFFASASGAAISQVVAADMPTGGSVILVCSGHYAAAT